MDGDVAGLFAVLAGGTFAIWRLLQGQKADALRIDAAWNEAARRLRGNAEGSNARYGDRILRASVDGKVLVIVAGTRSNGKGTGPPYVKVRRHTLTNLAELDVAMMKRGILGKIAKQIHLSEIESDDPPFQEEYRVTGAPAPLARAFLDRMTREHIRDLGEPFTIKDRELALERDGYPEDSNALVTMARYAEIMVTRWNALERAPKRFAADIGFVLSVDRVVLREGETTEVAKGMRRGHEITMTITLDTKELATRLSFAGGEVVLPGIECDPEAALKELDALLDAAPRQGGYR